jgi:hypothetical protein
MTAVHIVDLGRDLPQYLRFPFAEVRAARVTTNNASNTVVAVCLHGVHMTLEVQLAPQGTDDYAKTHRDNTTKTAHSIVADLTFFDADVDVIYMRDDYKSPWKRSIGAPPMRQEGA